MKVPSCFSKRQASSIINTIISAKIFATITSAEWSIPLVNHWLTHEHRPQWDLNPYFFAAATATSSKSYA